MLDTEDEVMNKNRHNNYLYGDCRLEREVNYTANVLAIKSPGGKVKIPQED